MEPASKNPEESIRARIKLVVWEETRGIHFELLWLRVLKLLFPDATPETRAEWLRSLGAEIGPETRFLTLPYLNGQRPRVLKKLSIGRNCLIEDKVVLDLQEHIEIGDDVHLAPGAMILTSTHEIGPKEHRAGALQRMPVTIESGVKIGPGALICPGVRVGAGAIVDARAMVNKEVPAGAFVSGNPATVKR
ncbi:MAG: hypothetical protein B6A08_16255 [Sorangiineae bacterium NIC37A_2]|nr:MAG: hypothetical protein B6A08_16255 [Sorangiineae bacterium NIC37A_2]